MVSLTSISIPDSNLAIFWDFRVDTDIRKCLFASSLIGTIIQDSSTRERSNDKTLSLSPKVKKKENKINDEEIENK